jgi:hypothetical protein
MARVTAVFDDQMQAERAISELRQRGIADAQMSIVSRRPEDVEVTKGPSDDKTGARVGKGALAGAGVGTLFRPGRDPHSWRGTIHHCRGARTALGATGATAGRDRRWRSGALAGAFAKAGYCAEAEFYGRRSKGGGVLVAVEADDTSSERRLGRRSRAVRCTVIAATN